jgi:hypothetical protein
LAAQSKTGIPRRGHGNHPHPYRLGVSCGHVSGGPETEAMRRVNAAVAEQAREQGGRVAFVCECGHCGGKLIPATLHAYELIRARDGLILATGHGEERTLQTAARASSRSEAVPRRRGPRR